MEKFNPDWAKDVPCRNIIIYGYCKKQKEGCPFKHDNDPLTEPSTTTVTSTTTNTAGSSADVHSDVQSHPNTVQLNGAMIPSLLSLSSLSKKNSTSPQFPVGLKFNAKNSESFTPMGTAPQLQHDSVESTTSPKLNIDIAKNAPFTPSFDAYTSESFTPTSTRGNPMDQIDPVLMTSLNLNNAAANGSQPASQQQQQQLQRAIPIDGPTTNNIMGQSIPPPQPLSGTIPIGAASIAGPPMFAPPPPRYPSIYPPPHSILQYHLYAPDPPPHLQLPLKPNERTPEMLFIPNNIREELVKKNLAALQNFPPGGALPDVVQDYYGLVPLDFHQKSSEKDRYNGHKNSLYKVFSNTDGHIYVLRRVHGITDIVEPPQISITFKKWNSLNCSNIVQLHDCFLTTAFGDSSLCFVYDYYPRAVSLYETHFVNFPLVPITQDCLWVYLIQLCNAIKTVHSKNLAVYNLDWEKILVTGNPGRIKISSCNEVEPLVYKEEFSFEMTKVKQQQDFVRLGELMFKLASSIQTETDHTETDDEIDKLNIDDQFKGVIRYLLSKEILSKDIQELSTMFVDKVYLVVEALTTYAEKTESILARELENSRLFRLMCKLNFIFGRVESRIDINWSESGDKFPIILFYDFVFHQVDSQGKSMMDLTHVLRCLNKLDAGVSEKLVLATPDEMTCIIISYKELKELISSTFRSLTQ
ncbi:similar to Saccharomyces cerevisiae YKL025C PAN3 Essential subunit of the Pan2p-Pan3p poly(A)- ribonuclease complex [Maudiozyma barnettii]|uniref:PAN2-PAN3 deadenylation complex subunit PAN3 n=1 Tax=Maudiozyma barnettii TaxID=61262 RepID=A0A8H2VJ21_9SACH|nr:Pan3p [Kazachstania barnettii]CAB4256475.1 similar to Saccharomyces cerevisiae YKL025C PAN3 Essential subunit of the Pan2p-Pan3p poly(A)- ribonuclease complex [Kazachstania barnettii]CAD1785084.1 similar to Saccharomyces cerevisiae YKL025C PAN3 Essential subunit of the Pan2p-Pan3p poly(A)- ribonuclease complex [Kazachstania barnettii]